MESQQFTELAQYYDQLMSDVPYCAWVDYLEDICARLEFHPKIVLDLACGTGNVTKEIHKRGYEVVGVDIAAQMIEIANNKSAGMDYSIKYYVQDAAELCLDKRFELVISLFDSLNYITDPTRLALGMKKVFEHLVPGGLFIFDVNTEYALSRHFFDQVNLDIQRYPRYIWNSTYNRATRLCRVEMTFEILDSGAPRQFVEIHYQRAYALEELQQMLESAGFEFVNSFDAYTFRKPSYRSDRVFFIAKRPE